MKSILVIDTPHDCSECDLMFQDDWSYWCPHRNAQADVYENVVNYSKPTWCPLSPLPLKKDLTHYIQRGDTQSMTHLVQYIHDQGYNDCLDEILKEAD